MARKDDFELPITGPDGEPVTYGQAKAYAQGVVLSPATEREAVLAKLVLALVDEAEQ